MRPIFPFVLIFLSALIVFIASFFQEEAAAPTPTPSDALKIPIGRTGPLSHQVTISLPQKDETITSPLTITGSAPGNWFFEATAPVVLTDWDGRIIAQHYVQAKGEWMTTDSVEFEGTLEFSPPENLHRQNGTLILQRHNASDMTELDAAVEIPVLFKSP